MNMETGAVRFWESLTQEERESGKWVKLPPHDTDGRETGPALCRARTLLDDIFPEHKPGWLDRMRKDVSQRLGEFDAEGKPR